MEAAKPLRPHHRDQFLREVADELARYPEIGDGVIGRVTAEIQPAWRSRNSVLLFALGAGGRRVDG